MLITVKAHKRAGRVVKQHTRKATKEKKRDRHMSMAMDGKTRLKDLADKSVRDKMPHSGRRMAKADCKM